MRGASAASAALFRMPPSRTAASPRSTPDWRNIFIAASLKALQLFSTRFERIQHDRRRQQLRQHFRLAAFHIYQIERYAGTPITRQQLGDGRVVAGPVALQPSHLLL